jgi:hypothetical protein
MFDTIFPGDYFTINNIKYTFISSETLLDSVECVIISCKKWEIEDITTGEKYFTYSYTDNYGGNLLSKNNVTKFDHRAFSDLSPGVSVMINGTMYTYLGHDRFREQKYHLSEDVGQKHRNYPCHIGIKLYSEDIKNDE